MCAVTTNRWFFYSDRSDETFIFEGNPSQLEGFQGWVTSKKARGRRKVTGADGSLTYKEPSVLLGGVLYFGRLLTATKVEGAPCSTNCRRATHPECRCSCHGKNHGIENRDMANAIQEEDVIYVGWEG